VKIEPGAGDSSSYSEPLGAGYDFSCASDSVKFACRLRTGLDVCLLTIFSTTTNARGELSVPRAPAR
jgi:hypothetical protein